MTKPTIEQVNDLLEYSSETGSFTWKAYRARGARQGQEAGVVRPNGYRSISINGRKYPAHRLAWFVTTGKWPSNEIDHINGVRDDNRIANLREATRAQNFQNKAMNCRNRSGSTGVAWDKDRLKWRAKICVDRKQIHLGLFDTVEDASAAYAAAKRDLHTFQPVQRPA